MILFPFVIDPWNEDFSFSLIKSTFLIAFMGIIWILVWRGNLLQPKLVDEKLKMEYILFIFIALLTFSTIFSADIYTSIVGAWTRHEGYLTWLGYLSVFYFYYRVINYDNFSPEKLLKNLFVVSAVISIYGILQHFDYDFISLIVPWESPTSSIAFFDNPNFYGTYLVLTMGIGMGLYIMASEKKPLLFYGIVLTLMTSVLLYTNTRSAWIGLTIVALFYTFTIVKQYKLWRKWMVLLLAMGIMVVGINATEGNRYLGKIFITLEESGELLEEGLTGHEGSSRLIIWQKDVTILDDYFWIGSGIDTHAIVFPATPDELEEYFNNRTIMVDKAHNEYLQIAVTIGIPALLVYLLLLFKVYRRAFQTLKGANKQQKHIIFTLLAVITGYLVQAIFNISVVSVAPILWMFLGIVYGYSTKIHHQFTTKENNNY
ncbi:O-antigen ligase family protein [Paenisporosarcina sp. TG-14]|uniref:O-antigen ligase family protein n=1 Tax=Paenisporosarcina sp. TG-14 TaxID=1231057 RepID=UPI0002ED677B|nr:O-antigen ligase family protein [Paenisporosarcina sp. TG-14]